MTRQPSVRLPTIVAGQTVDEEALEGEPVIVELPTTNRFGIAWPTEVPQSMSALPVQERPTGVELSSSDTETDLEEDEARRQVKRSPKFSEASDADFATPTNHMVGDRDPMELLGHAPSIPRFSRAFSMPLPSQLGSLQNPRRVPSSSSGSPPSPEEPEDIEGPFQELSLELADSVQMVIQTLLQLSPPQVLDPAKEQFSACSLSIPTPSVSAMFTSMKNLNYMSANMSVFSSDATATRRAPALPGSNTYVDFDVGEMLQSVGDALSGVAAQAGVDLVLFHGDLGMRHVAVKGDESGISYTLSHILRQIVSVARKGDSIEVGLFVEPAGGSPGTASPTHAPRSGSPNLGTEGPLRCTFHVGHRYGLQLPSEALQESRTEDADSRSRPSFQSLILRRLLLHVGASLEANSPPKAPIVGSWCALSVTLDRGAPSVVDPTVNLTPEEAAYLGYPADMRIAHEPTLEQLTQFAESLKGRKVTLFAHSKGSFAQHMTSYLTTWGLDVSHVSIESDPDRLPDNGAAVADASPETAHDGVPVPLDSTSSTSSSPNAPTADPFVLIDDDVSTLRAHLQRIRAEQAYPLHLHSRKRPSLASQHRPRSSPQVARLMGMTAQAPQSVPPIVIVHFTSLSNFKLVKDAIQSIVIPGGGPWSRLPEVIVIPKPAGPRRILTALHTAVTKPIVDPFFVPIATSPISPGFHLSSPLFNLTSAQKSPGGRSTGSFRTDRSKGSPKDTYDVISIAPSSPLGGGAEGVEYFSDSATRVSNPSPSSGIVIQSPDGQPAGIFFHPKARKNTVGTPQTEAHPAPPGSDSGARARGGSFRRTGDGEDGKRVLSTPQSEVLRRSPRVPHAPEPSAISEGISARDIAGWRNKTRQLSGGDIPPPPLPEPIPEVPPVPRLTHTQSQIEPLNAAHSPPHSPQTRTGAIAGPSQVRRPGRRPTVESSASAPVPSTKKGGRGGEANIVPPISVLIVDDNPINQTILSTFMKKKKVKYDVANNGEEAVQKWRTGGFHLILMDIQMPVMDGIQATKEIRRMEKQGGTGGFPGTPQSEGQRTPSEASTTSDSRSSMTPSYRSSVIIVALTASSLQSDRVAALAAGCNDFLTKPVHLPWLNNKIIEWGSIKALQMWADIRPDVVKSITTGQAAQNAQNVASKLHVPEGRSTPSAAQSRSGSQTRQQHQMSAAEAAATLSRQDSSFKDRSPSGTPSGTPPKASPEAGAVVPAASGSPPGTSASGVGAETVETIHEGEPSSAEPRAPREDAENPFERALAVRDFADTTASASPPDLGPGAEGGADRPGDDRKEGAPAEPGPPLPDPQ